MAIKLIANYSKRLGLPGYSSHQFSVSVETELVSIDDVAGESGRLYGILQSNVDEQMLKTGFVPPTTYGLQETPGNDSGSPNPRNGATHAVEHPAAQSWRCSEKQKGLILKLVEEHQLDKNHIEELAIARFGKGVRQLNKIEASGLIEELIDTHGQKPARQTQRLPRERRAA